jgi:hypothetical protein
MSTTGEDVKADIKKAWLTALQLTKVGLFVTNRTLSRQLDALLKLGRPYF